MIQDIYPHQLNNHYDPGVQAKKEDTLLCIVNGRILVEETCFEENELRFPRVKDLADEYVADIRYLFAIDDSRYFLCDHLLGQKDIPEGYAYVDEKSLRTEGIGPDEALFAAVTGKHLADWYRDTKFCGRCGHEMQHSKTERAMVCPACHYTAYPAHYAGGDRWGGQWRQIAHYPLPHRLSLQCPDRGLYGDRRDHGGNRAKRSDGRSRHPGQKYPLL